MTRFLEALVDCGCVTTAAKCVGMSRQSAYRLRSRLVGQPFDIAWEGAFEIGIQQIAHAALDRALNGTLVPVYYKGEQVGERRVFNERAVMNIVANANQIGRNPVARNFTSRNWTGILRRIEQGPINWTDDEHAEIDSLHPLRDENDYQSYDQFFDQDELDTPPADSVDDGPDDSSADIADAVSKRFDIE